ncbi:MAG: AraC family transcriptional regulator [Thermodesulfobacteriota bacterium]
MGICLKTEPVVPQYRSMHATRILIDLAEKRGIAVNEILENAGLDYADLDNPDKWISFDQELGIYLQLADLIPDPGFGLLLGQNYHIGQLGKWVMAVNCCTTVLEAFKTAFTLIDLAPVYFQYILETKGDTAYFRFREIFDPGKYRCFIHEAHAVGFYYVCREIMKEPPPLTEVRFAYPKPDYVDKYKKIFSCPIVFNAEETQALFAGRYLEKALPCSNVLTKNLYEKECRRLLQDLDRFSTTTGRVKQVLLSYDNAFPGMTEMARRFNMSPQTLGRRLAAEGTDYKTLSRQVREKRACDLLKITGLSIEEIAGKLGYSDTANFYRAFKSWTGQTPLDFRRKNT